MRGFAYGRGFRRGGNDHRPQHGNTAARGEWARGDQYRWWFGVEDSTLGQRNGRISVSPMEHGGASCSSTRSLSSRGGQNWSAGRVWSTAVRTHGAPWAIAGRAAHG